MIFGAKKEVTASRFSVGWLRFQNVSVWQNLLSGQNLILTGFLSADDLESRDAAMTSAELW